MWRTASFLIFPRKGREIVQWVGWYSGVWNSFWFLSYFMVAVSIHQLTILYVTGHICTQGISPSFNQNDEATLSIFIKWKDVLSYFLMVKIEWRPYIFKLFKFVFLRVFFHISTFKTKCIVHINTFNIYNALFKKYFTWIPMEVVVIVMCSGISCLFCEQCECFLPSLFKCLTPESGFGEETYIPF